MKQYIGTKCIKAKPQSHKGADGYQVEYEGGYLSWSPKEHFERAYSSLNEGISFSHAFILVLEGREVRRMSWPEDILSIGYCCPIDYPNRLFCRCAPGTLVHYTPTDEDLFATDWCII